MACNRVVLCGRISEIAPLRYTPAGVSALDLVIAHDSEQWEAGFRRRAVCEVPLLAMAETAIQAARFKVGDTVGVEGFLARRGRQGMRLVLHVKRIELI